MYTLADLRYQAQRRTQEELLVHLKSFSLDIKLSVGIWYFAPSGGRFHDRYVADLSIPQRLELAAEMARYGVTGIEAHYPSEVNDKNLHLYKQLEKEAGVRLVGLGPDSFRGSQ
jgi:xylose isomerase